MRSLFLVWIVDFFILEKSIFGWNNNLVFGAEQTYTRRSWCCNNSIMFEAIVTSLVFARDFDFFDWNVCTLAINEYVRQWLLGLPIASRWWGPELSKNKGLWTWKKKLINFGRLQKSEAGRFFSILKTPLAYDPIDAGISRPPNFVRR